MRLLHYLNFINNCSFLGPCPNFKGPTYKDPTSPRREASLLKL